MLIKKILSGLLIFLVLPLYGMDRMELDSESNTDKDCIILKVGTKQGILKKNNLPPAWYTQLIVNGLVESRDERQRPIITLNNISPDLLPLFIDILNWLQFMSDVSERKSANLAYKALAKKELTVEQAGQLLLELDFIGVPKSLISGLARFLVQLTEDQDIDLTSFNDHIQREINRYFYLLYNRYLEEAPLPSHWLQDLFKFDRIDKAKRIVQQSRLQLEKLSVMHICALYKLYKYGIDPKLLTIVDLTNNQLTDIPTDLLKHCPQLLRLALNNNQLTAIPADLLKHSPQLQVLGLDNNQLTAIPADLLKHSPQLQVLGLDNNQLTAIPADLLKHCPQLKQLWLNNNQFSAIPADLLKHCPQLQQLGLNNNQLTALPADLLMYCPQLQVLKLNNNQLTAIPANLLKRCSQLQLLGLNNNKLTALPADLLKHCSQLQLLGVGKNKLTALPADLVKHCPQLLKLWLNNNQLTTIPADLLKHCPQLQLLGLHNNQLTAIPWQALIQLQHLDVLIIENNQLSLPEDLSEQLQKAIISGQKTLEALTRKRAAENKEKEEQPSTKKPRTE